MNKYLLGSALAGLALATPVAVSAQAVPAAVVAVVDRDRIAGTCTQCAAANQQLQAQIQQYQAREQQVGAPLQTEGQAIQTALNAIPQGGQPDATLRQRYATFQANQQAAERELSGRQETIRRNQGYVVQQIVQRMDPLIAQVMRERGANLALDVAATLAHAPALDVTDSVLALMNQNAAPFGVTAPPPPQQPTAPGAIPPRPATTPATTPPRPRPQGR
jgi:Skp family chaperone for outer membrane proteins